VLQLQIHCLFDFFPGYGGISPRTQWGRVAALVYALFGIPIVLLYLSAMGEALSAGMRCLFRRQRVKGGPGGGPGGGASGGVGSGAGGSGGGRKTDKNKGQGHYGHQKYGLPPSVYQQQQAQQAQQAQQQQAQQAQQAQQQQVQQGKKSSGNRRGSPSVPISICVCVLLCYVSSGAILFHKLQNWVRWGRLLVEYGKWAKRSLAEKGCCATCTCHTCQSFFGSVFQFEQTTLSATANLYMYLYLNYLWYGLTC